MTSSPRQAGRSRFFLCVVLLGLAFALSGCVYLRLLQLKRQLGAFDEHFTLNTAAGVRLNCLEPVLLADDIRWLGFEPFNVRTVGSAQQWHIRWLKQKAPDDRAPGSFEIAFDLMFADGKLTALSIPERYFSVLPKDVIVSAIKSLGGANVDKKDRRVESQVRLALGDDEHAWPTRSTILSVLGQPTTERRDDAHLTWHYHFVSADLGKKGEDIDLRLVFSSATEKLTRIHGHLPVGRLNLNFAE